MTSKTVAPHPNTLGRRACRSAALAATLLFGAGVASAYPQARPAPGMIDGVVTDTNLVSLSGATASLLGTKMEVVTGANGRFRILSLPAGSSILVVRHLGYAATTTALRVTEGDTLRMSFALERVASALDTVLVAGRRLSPRMAEFEDRRSRGFGQFMTRDQIEKRNGVFTADLIRTFQSVSIVTPRGRRFDQVAFNIRSGCPFKLFLDGIALSSSNLADLPTPRDLAGIEVYSGAATIPLQDKSTGGSFCGVILFWTRDGP